MAAIGPDEDRLHGRSSAFSWQRPGCRIGRDELPNEALAGGATAAPPNLYAGEKQVGLCERDLTSLRMSTEREKTRQAELERLMPCRGQELSLEQELKRIAREVEAMRPRAVDRDPVRRPERGEGMSWDRGR